MREFRRSGIVIDGEVTISYLVSPGVEPATVLLHGLAGSSREFLATATALGDRAVILIDQRGHGHSTRRPADTSRAAFVRDVARVIEAEGAAPVDLVGQSMGAHTAMLVASAYPALVHRLVMLEGNEGGGTPESHQQMGDFFRSWPVFPTREAAASFLGEGPLERAWVDDLHDCGDGLRPSFDWDVMVDVISHLSQPRWDEWARVTAPTLVVYAERGLFTEDEKSRFVAHRPGISRVDLPHASHDAHLDAFEPWVEALREFLS